MDNQQLIQWKKHPTKPHYIVSNTGNIIDLLKAKSGLRGKPNNMGYLRCSTGEFVHRLVAILFITNDDPDNQIQVNHIDGNKQNNNATNLEWVTRSQNTRHSIDTLRNGIGSKNKKTKLTENQVHSICSLYTSCNITQKELAELFNVAVSTIKAIVYNRSWKYISKLYFPLASPTTISKGSREKSLEAQGS